MKTLTQKEIGRSLQDTESAIREKVAAMVGVAAADIDPREPLHRYGLTSAQALELMAFLSERAGHGLAPTLVWEHPSAGALARFKNGYADGVIGGRFSTLPYFAASNIARSRLVVDPVPGLFGLSFVRAEGFLATDTNRDALARAIAAVHAGLRCRAIRTPESGAAS